MKVTRAVLKTPPLQVPQDRLSELDISKMAQSQNNPYMHLIDYEVNLHAKSHPKAQKELGDPPQEPQEQQEQRSPPRDIPEIETKLDQKVKDPDNKELGELDKKYEDAAEVLKLIIDSTEEKEKEDKGKKPLAFPQQPQMVPTPSPVDEAAGSSKVFSMAQWQTQMQEQVKEATDAYQLKVLLKLDAQKMYDDLSNQVQDIIIEKVKQES